MSSVCQTYLQASNTSLFDNSCAIQKSAVTPAVLTGLTTCCVGGGGVHTTDDGCFTYCNITSSYDGLFWEFCLLDNLSTSEVAILFADDNDADWSGCTDDDESGTNTATTVPVGNIATTWIGEGQTITISSAGAAVTTEVLPTGPFLDAIFGGDSTTTSGVTKSNTSGTSKPTGTTSGKPSGTSSGPASTSSKPSKASVGISFSKAGATLVVGFALFTALL